MSDSSTQRFTIIEMAGAVFVVLFILFLLYPAIFRGHGHGHGRLQDMSNLRQISICLTAYVIDNEGFGPGLDNEGNLMDPKVESRYSLLMDYIGPSDCLISPYEYDEKVQWASDPVTTDHYSYAMLQLPESGGRLTLWSELSNVNTVWISGRNTGSNADTQINSLQSNAPGEWQGPIGWADGHVTSEEDQYVDTRYTVESDTPLNKDDNLFEAVSEDDAYMIYTGN